jgi:hypothetical protein
MKTVWDIKPPKAWIQKKRLEFCRARVNKFFSNLEVRGGVVGNKAVLFCYNDDAPELSYIITEQL